MDIRQISHFDIDSDEEEQLEAWTKHRKQRTSFKQNFLHLLQWSVPTYWGILIEDILYTITLICVGHLDGDTDIAVIGIVETMTLIFFYYPVISNIGAIDTYVSASYGNKQYYLCGVFLNRSILILTILSLPFIWVQFFMKDIMMILGQDPELWMMAQKYIYYKIPTLLIMLYEEILKSYFLAMGYFRFWVSMCVIQLLVHSSLWFLLILYFEMSFLGAAIAFGTAKIVGILTPLVYFKLISPDQINQKWIHLFNKDSFKRLWDFISLSIPSMLMCLIEGVTFEIMTLLAGTLGVNSLSAHIVLSDILNKIYMSWYSIAIASSSLIGKELGDGNFINAKLLSRWTIALGLIAAVIEIIIILFLHNSIFSFYTDNIDVIGQLKLVIIPLLIEAWLDNIQGTLKGVFRAIGSQKQAAIIYMISFGIIGNFSSYMIGIPLNLELVGLWYGYGIGNLICSSIFIALLIRINWKDEWTNAMERIGVNIEDDSKHHIKC